MYFRSAHLFAVLAFGLLGDAATAQEAGDMKLDDVGFVMRPANTPQQLERLRLLPPRTFVARVSDGRRYYIYADPDYCRCVFLGGEMAMQNYRDLATPPTPIPTGPDSGPPSWPFVLPLPPDIAIGNGDTLDYSY
ncbi:MAG: hypothetical protein WBD95_18075 [Xanthobacteraceae bacterium]